MNGTNSIDDELHLRESNKFTISVDFDSNLYKCKHENC